MKPSSKPLFLVLFGLILITLASCTPTPNCSDPYNVTKIADTNDGVCSSGDCSLREAILNANACPGPQVINLPTGGYALSLDGDDEDLGETGDLDITDDLTIIGVLPPPSIHGGIERAFHIHSGASVVFDHIWLTDGSAIYGGGLVNEGDTLLTSFTCNYNSVAIPPGGMGDAMGGCIFNTGNLTIQDAQFLANTAGFGGAIYNYDSATLTIENADFTGNEADGNGGAIWNGVNASLNIDGGLYRLNEAAVNGGAIWNHGTADVVNIVLEENLTGANGGGVYNWSPGFAIFTNSWFTENTSDLGGGLYNSQGLVHLYQSGLSANTAATGGGVYNEGPSTSGALLLKNVTVSGNTASSGLGGGIYNNGNFDFRFITVAENSGEGLRIDGGTEIKLRSSALSNNVGGNCAGVAPDSLRYNISSDASCGFTDPNDLSSTDPLLEPLAANGGMAPSHALGVSSPAIDTGVPDLCIAIDQNGTTRPQGPWCDRGAHENLYEKGIVRGWTYIDANRDDIRDPADGAVSGMILELKEGTCPGGSIIATTTSASPDGFYEIIDIEPGNYCLARSMIQQTLYPDYHDLTFGPGDILEEVNFRYLLSPLGDSSISGKIWHDECAVPYGTPSTPPPGCIWLPGGGLGADGIYNPSESGIAGIKIELYGSGCSAAGYAPSAIVYSDANGDYSIPDLVDYNWCVEVNAGLSPNDSIIIPGNWTYPVRDASPAVAAVVLATGEHALDINFGWDYQFLPSPPISYSFMCVFISDAFGRKAGLMDAPEAFVALEGDEFEVLAKSEAEEPVWFYGKTKTEEFGWVSELVLDCEGLELDKLFFRPYPLLIDPDKVPDDGEHDQEGCRKDLNMNECILEGGKWNRKTLQCDCPPG